jgi:intracellular multiplication protein IcmD
MERAFMLKNNKIFKMMIGIALMMFVGLAMAATIGDVANNISNSLSSVATMLGAASYVVGTGMFMVAIFQLKQHKENPTQTPLSKPMLFLIVAASLLYLPTLMGVTSGTLFTNAQTSRTGSW